MDRFATRLSRLEAWGPIAASVVGAVGTIVVLWMNTPAIALIPVAGTLQAFGVDLQFWR